MRAELPAVRSNLSVAAIAASILAAGWLGAGRPAVERPGAASTEASEPAVVLHVRLRTVGKPAQAGLQARIAGSGGSQRLVELAPLFTRVPSDPGDPRARWLQLTVHAPATIERILEALRVDPDVERAFVVPEITLATQVSDPTASLDRAGVAADPSCPITTPSFESYQGYLGPAPHGIDAPAAWRLGHRGQGVWFADIEGGWNASHEDLPGDRIRHVGGKQIPGPAWRAHGTAVLGEVVGRDNGKGVVGIAPDVERVFTSSIGGTSVANAIDVAAAALRPGDVLLIELQGTGPRRRYIPVEYWDDVFDAIRAATSRGVTVVEAAGNGGEDLDHPTYKRAFDRGYRDSGAILVGAGAPPRAGFTDRARLEFSNYGGRVDVQGWGRKVATLDYGDLQKCAGADRHYTGEFSGTSSASPIVAGAAVIVQGVARAGGGVLSTSELRALLRRTGTPQQGKLGEQIGPRPDLERALAALPR